MSPSASIALNSAPAPSTATWFAREVQPHEPALRAFLASRFQSGPELDDVVQEAYLRVIRTHEKGGITNAKSFLFTTARNVALDWCRHNQVVRMDGLDETDSSSVIEEKPDAAEATNHAQEIELLSQAIETLPERCREVLRLRKLHGLSYRDIAIKLGITEGTVNAHLATGAQRCREYLLAHGVFRAASRPTKSPKS